MLHRLRDLPRPAAPELVPAPLVLLGAVLLLAATFLVDALTGPDVTLALFYVPAVWLGTLGGGIRIGIIMSGAAALGSVLVQMTPGGELAGQSSIVGVSQIVLRLSFFALAATAFHLHGKAQHALEALQQRW